MLNRLYWLVRKQIFIMQCAIDGIGKKSANVLWSYKMLDYATLREFPETPKHLLPSNSRARKEPIKP